MIRTSRARPIACLLAGTLLVAACGGGETSTETSGPDVTASPVATATVTSPPEATPTAQSTATPAPSATPASPVPSATATAPSSPSATVPAPTPTPNAPPATEPPVTAAPWAGPTLPQAAVSSLLVAAWNESDRAGPALYPEGVEVLHPEATARRADFSGGWGLAWDRPDGPGRAIDGSYCADCGRSAFGVAGTRSDTVLDDLGGAPLGTVTWSDGSRAAWFYEGFAAPASGAPLLAYLELPEYPVLYQVWSFLGEDDLMTLLGRLRLVEGLGATGTVEQAGPAPWAGPALRFGDLPQVYADEWAEAGAPAGCPCLALATLGPEAADATIRRAENAGESLIAWDRPRGPGHDAQGVPCEDCGRGAIGLGTFQSGELPGPPTLEWDDGSVARIVPGLYGTEAWIRPAGADCIYWLWSHLGADHVRFLLTQLRRVEN